MRTWKMPNVPIGIPTVRKVRNRQLTSKHQIETSEHLQKILQRRLLRKVGCSEGDLNRLNDARFQRLNEVTARRRHLSG